MEYLEDHPPAHIILASVHAPKRIRNRKMKTVEQPNIADDLRREVLQIGGSIRGPLPAVYRD